MADPAQLQNIRALLLAERIDHRRLPRAQSPTADPIHFTLPGGKIAFAFRWGAIVLINATPLEEAAVLAELRPLLGSPLKEAVVETAPFTAGAAEDGIDPQGVIHLREDDAWHLAVVAEALAKSAALAHQEANLAETLDGMEPVIAGLRSRGRLTVSSRSLLRSIGTALAARNHATTRIQAEDKPDVLWDHPELDRFYSALSESYELRDRSAALDRKLNLIGETVETLLSLIETRRSLGLELAIVTLIAIELLTALYSLFFT